MIYRVFKRPLAVVWTKLMFVKKRMCEAAGYQSEIIEINQGRDDVGLD